MAEESGQNEQPAEQPAKRRQQVPLEVRERKLAPKPSFWPIVLALALVVALIGVMVHPIMLAVGVVLTVAAVIGWVLEKH